MAGAPINSDFSIYLPQTPSADSDDTNAALVPIHNALRLIQARIVALISTVNANQAAHNVLPSYTTAGRPAAGTTAVGTEIWNTTTTKPNYCDGTNWRDAAGTVV